MIGIMTMRLIYDNFCNVIGCTLTAEELELAKLSPESASLILETKAKEWQVFQEECTKRSVANSEFMLAQSRLAAQQNCGIIFNKNKS